MLTMKERNVILKAAENIAEQPNASWMDYYSCLEIRCCARWCKLGKLESGWLVAAYCEFYGQEIDTSWVNEDPDPLMDDSTYKERNELRVLLLLLFAEAG